MGTHFRVLMFVWKAEVRRKAVFFKEKFWECFSQMGDIHVSMMAMENVRQVGKIWMENDTS